MKVSAAQLKRGDIVTITWEDHCSYSDVNKEASAPCFLFTETREVDAVYPDRIVCYQRTVESTHGSHEQAWSKDVYVRSAIRRIDRWGNRKGR